ncbi:MAG: DUF1501 domain-containing protein [Candidatus Sumerlaeota bacterium]|nr:DUF1501 domain-containing protein [Candidatus Sumerlaeota bacterium]
MSISISRRDLMRQGLLGAAGLCLADRLAVSAFAAAPQSTASAPPTVSPPSSSSRKAKSVIQIWMWGGPAHLDTFDPKPEAGNDYCGPFNKPIETNVPGIRICELLPLLAKQADKYSIIRSMTHGANAHETASYMMQTGRKAGERLVYPGAGAVVSYFKGYDGGYKGQIPPYIVLTEPQGRFDEAGFLGTRYKAFATGGDPAQSRFMVEGIVAEGIADKQQRDRRDLLGKLDTLKRSLPEHPALQALARSEEQAYDMILGDGAKVFDLADEKDALRDRYGRVTLAAGAPATQIAPRTTFGQSCLVARRLVERGVPYITINYPGWDTHKDHFVEMKRKLPELDQGMSALIQDLSERGMLDGTIIWWGGEFGRSPKIQWEAPWNGGRGHWGNAFCAVVAGGGFKGGHVVGATDAKGEEVKERPVYPRDLIGSIYQLLGIDLGASLPHPQGMDAHVIPTAGENIPTGGLLNGII